MQIVMDVLKDNTTIKSLTVKGSRTNNLKSVTLNKMLCGMLSVNSYIECLTISYDILSTEKLKSLSLMLIKNHSIKNLSFKFDKMSSQRLEILGISLMKNDAVRNLRIVKLEITKKGVTSLVKVLESNNSTVDFIVYDPKSCKYMSPLQNEQFANKNKESFNKKCDHILALNLQDYKSVHFKKLQQFEEDVDIISTTSKRSEDYIFIKYAASTIANTVGKNIRESKEYYQNVIRKIDEIYAWSLEQTRIVLQDVRVGPLIIPDEIINYILSLLTDLNILKLPHFAHCKYIIGKINRNV